MLVLLTSKVDGATYCDDKVDKNRSDGDEPDVQGIAEGERFIRSGVWAVDRSVADVARADLVSLLGVAEEEVGLHLCQGAPLGHREVADLEEDEDGKLVLKGDRVHAACAVGRIWRASLADQVQRGFVVFRQHLKEFVGD